MRNTLLRQMARSVFEQVNEEIFGNTLAYMPIHIRRRLGRENTYACYAKGQMWIFSSQLEDCGRFLPHQLFAIVAHEMIHHAQYMRDTLNANGMRSYAHNNAFFRHYARRIESCYGHKIAAMQMRYEG